jgi:hypothetical protein
MGPLGIRPERLELACPEPFDVIQPTVQLNERLGAQAEDAQPRVVLDRHGLDEAGSMKQPEMSARRRCAHAQSGSNLTGALWFASQQLDDAAPCRIGERSKSPIDVGACCRGDVPPAVEIQRRLG